MNVFSEFHRVIEKSLEELAAAGKLPAGLDPSRVTVEPPRDPAHGDISTNAAMVLSRQAGMKPRELAETLVGALRTAPAVRGAEVAGPGFVNLSLEDAFWQAQVREILLAGDSYGGSAVGRGRRVNVEYVSANPTGPMHVGHGRGAVVGDALASLLAKAGFEVTREYYVNDAGGQLEALARSVHYRYREALGEDVGPVPEGLYPGDYLVPVGEALARRDGDRWLKVPEVAGGEGGEGWREACARFGRDAMMAVIREDLAALGVAHDAFVSESDLHREGRIGEVVDALERRGLVYRGTLEPPKGKVVEDWEPREQLLFRSTDFGDDVDRPLQKSDGSWTYFAADIAYHYDKFRRGFADMIDVWGADHKGYVRRMQAAVKAITGDKGSLDVRICNLVHLYDRGEPVKMSKRAGTFVTLREVIDKVGRDVVRFIMLTRGNEAALDFDFARVVEQSKDNPVFYVQYAHARACSVTRNVAAEFPDMGLDNSSLADADLSRLDDPNELALMKLLAGWPRQVEIAAEAHEPHRVAYYLADVAAAFHGLWTKGNEDERLRFIVADDAELTAARLALVRAVAIVVASGLTVMGVQPVEEMR